MKEKTGVFCLIHLFFIYFKKTLAFIWSEYYILILGTRGTQHIDIQLNDIQLNDIQLHDTQHNDIQLSDTHQCDTQLNDNQHKGLICDTVLADIRPQ